MGASDEARFADGRTDVLLTLRLKPGDRHVGVYSFEAI